MLDRQLGDVLILNGAQYQNRNLRSRTKEPIKRTYAMAVGEKEVCQHRCYTVRPMLLLSSGLDQPLESLDAVPDPFDLKDAAARVGERLANSRCVRQIIFDQQDVLRHRVLLAPKPRLLYLATPYGHRLCGIEHNNSDGLLTWNSQNPYVR